MTTTVLFDSPLLLGFEQTRVLIDRAVKAAAESYPPYNVEARDDDHMRISLAVAGFTPEQLSVTVEDRQLVISGKRDGEDRAFLHRGIAARGIRKDFVLAAGLEVEGASLEHGLLHVDVTRPEPASAIRHVPIRTGG